MSNRLQRRYGSASHGQPDCRTCEGTALILRVPPWSGKYIVAVSRETRRPAIFAWHSPFHVKQTIDIRLAAYYIVSGHNMLVGHTPEEAKPTNSTHCRVVAV